jgi:hypothetical protein
MAIVHSLQILLLKSLADGETGIRQRSSRAAFDKVRARISERRAKSAVQGAEHADCAGLPQRGSRNQEAPASPTSGRRRGAFVRGRFSGRPGMLSLRRVVSDQPSGVAPFVLVFDEPIPSEQVLSSMQPS